MRRGTLNKLGRYSAFAGVLLITGLAAAQTAGPVQWRSYGPFRGFVGSVPRHAAPAGSVVDGDSSRNWLVDPTEGKLIRRKGSAAIDSALAEANPTTGWYGRHIFPVNLTGPGDPVLGRHAAAGVLMADENQSAAQLTFTYDSTGATGTYILGRDCRPFFALTGVDDHSYISIPLAHGNLLTRGADTTGRNQLAAGSRKVADVGNWLYLPNAKSTPAMWNKSFNLSGITAVPYNRIRPWGQYTPLYAPDAPVANYPTRTSEAGYNSWTEADKFFVSVAFEFEDGSFSMPVVPNLATYSAGDTTGGDRGLVVIPNDGDSVNEYFAYVPWRNIPIGPHGTVARWLLRTPKLGGAQKTTPAFRDLRVTAVLRNNTQTAYNDPNGADDALVINSEVIRFDHMWPRQARYVFANDSRVVIGGAALPNKAAFFLAPTGKDVARNINGNTTTQVGFRDTDDLVGGPLSSGEAFGYRVRSDSLILYFKTSSAITRTAFPFTAVPTIRALVDTINKTTVSGGGKEWSAQIVPGADDAEASTYLAITGTTNGTGANDYQRFGGQAGRDSIVWSRGPSWPSVVYFNANWQSQFTEDHQSIWFTGAGPGHAQSAPNNFYVGNRRQPPNRAVGRLMGGAPIRDKFVIAYERAIYLLRNTRGGGTGLDEDYRLIPINESRGCISWSSIASGDGWVGYMTPDGYVVTDGEAEVLISRDVWNAEKQAGEWAYEMGQCRANTSTNADTTSGFNAFVFGSQLHITYKKSSAATFPNRRLVYDFSAGSAASGLAELLNQGQPYGWSTPLDNYVSTMGFAQVDANGPYRLGYADKSVRGRLDKFDADSLNHGVPIRSVAFLPTDFGDTYQLKAAEQLLALYKKPATGLSVTFYRDQARTDAYTTTLATTSTNLFGRSVADLALNARAATSSFELKLVDDGTSSTQPEVWVLALKYRILDSVR